MSGLRLMSGSSKAPTTRKTELAKEQDRRRVGDPSVLRPPLSVTVTGIRQALKALSCGSQEVIIQ